MVRFVDQHKRCAKRVITPRQRLYARHLDRRVRPGAQDVSLGYGARATQNHTYVADRNAAIAQALYGLLYKFSPVHHEQHALSARNRMAHQRGSDNRLTRTSWPNDQHTTRGRSPDPA